jgi:hypothetical protein
VTPDALPWQHLVPHSSYARTTPVVPFGVKWSVRDSRVLPLRANFCIPARLGATESFASSPRLGDRGTLGISRDVAAAERRTKALRAPSCVSEERRRTESRHAGEARARRRRKRSHSWNPLPGLSLATEAKRSLAMRLSSRVEYVRNAGGVPFLPLSLAVDAMPALLRSVGSRVVVR